VETHVPDGLDEVTTHFWQPLQVELQTPLVQVSHGPQAETQVPLVHTWQLASLQVSTQVPLAQLWHGPGQVFTQVL
jgi:hypothetical protein